MELTERCNNNCIHCTINLPADELNAKKRELSTKDIEHILEEAASLGCLKVRFTGGEPLLREDFESLYVFARSLGLRTVIQTNATLITTSLAKLFARIPPLELIHVSVYGMKRESYEAVTRVAGSYEAARQGMACLLDHHVPFVVRGVLLPPNKGELQAFESWARTIPWMKRPPDYVMSLDLRCRRDSQAKNRAIRELRLRPEEAIELSLRRQKAYFKEMREFCGQFMGPQGPRLFSCGAGVGGGCVDAYGGFQACLLLKAPELTYDLRQGSLEDALRGFFPAVRKTKAENPDYLARCGRCFLMGLCAQCPARSWIEHGALDVPVAHLCEVAHAEARALGLLGEQEWGWEVEDWRKRVLRFSQEKHHPDEEKKILGKGEGFAGAAENRWECQELDEYLIKDESGSF
jgi:MoaA/NifB/PqqE/SkfB family radical SAM enzyme